MTVNFGNIPEPLTSIPQWGMWRYVSVPGRPKPTKPFYSVHGYKVDLTNPTNWTDFETVKDAYINKKSFDGIGFVMTENLGIVGVDIDHKACPAFVKSHGIHIIDPEAQQIIKELDSYSEYSPSGKGFRIFTKGTIPVDGTKEEDYEIYKNGRYLTLTGDHLPGTPTQIMERQPQIDRVFNRIFGAQKETPKVEKSTPRANVDVSPVLQKMFSSKHGDKIKALFDGKSEDHASASEADLALCGHLAYWSDNDAVIMDAAFRQSALMRPKWDEKHYSTGLTYGQNTIATAIEGNPKEQNTDTTENTENTGGCEDAIVNRIKRAMLSGGAALRAEIDRIGIAEDTIEGILPESAGFFAMYSGPGQGKSFTILDWLLSISTGTPYHGREVKKKVVVYVAAEGQAGVLKRIMAWLNYHGLTLDALADFHLLPIPIIIDDDKTLQAAITAIRALNIKPGIIVLDTLARSMQGDENSTRDMGKVVSAAGMLREETGAQVGLIHHSGKDDERGPRGAIALTGATDALYKTRYSKKDQVFTLIFERYKDDETPQPMFFRAEKILTGMFDKKGKELCSLVPILDNEIKEQVVKSRATGLKGANQIAYHALEQMLKQKGIEPPGHVADQIATDGVVLPITQVIDEDTWRQHCYDVGISPKGKTQSALKNAFDRACKHLLAEDHIRCFDSYYWIPIK
jgi:hypothetical protein